MPWPHLHMNTSCVNNCTCTAPSHTNMLYQNSSIAFTRLNMLYMPYQNPCTRHQRCFKTVPTLSLHSENQQLYLYRNRTCTFNTMYLTVQCPPVPQFCTHASTLPTVLAHDLSSIYSIPMPLHIQGVKRHQISVWQSSWSYGFRACTFFGARMMKSEKKYVHCAHDNL
jgi:hypothetical protein